MQIRKFTAPDMAQALRAVREEMGPDAVVLSSREVREKEGIFGFLSAPSVEVMVAADSPVVTTPAAPAYSAATVFQSPQAASASHRPWMGGQDMSRSPSVGPSDRGAFDAVLDEMVQQPDVRGLAVETVYEELREIKESITALRVKVASASRTDDSPLYDELRGVKEGLNLLRVKMATRSAGRSDDAAIHEGLQTILESVGSLRLKVGGLATPSSEIYEALQGLGESVAAMAKKEATRKADLPSNSPVYDELRAVREAVHTLTLKALTTPERKIELPADAPIYDELRAVRGAIQSLTQQMSSLSSRSEPPVVLPLDSPIYDELGAVRSAIQALTQQMSSISNRSEPPVHLPIDSPIYGELGAIKAALSALPAREIVTVEGSGGASDDLVYDALNDLQTAMRGLQERQEVVAARSDPLDRGMAEEVRTSLGNLVSRFSNMGDAAEAQRIQATAQMTDLRKQVDAAVGVLRALISGSATEETARQFQANVEAQGIRTTAEMADLRKQVDAATGTLRDLISESATETARQFQASVGAESVAQQTAGMIEASDLRHAELAESISALRSEMTQMRRAVSDGMAQIPPPATEMAAPEALLSEMREMRAAISAIQTSPPGGEAAPTALPIELYEEFNTLKGDIGALQASIAAMADQRLAVVQRTHEEMRDMRETLAGQQYRNELATLRPFLTGLFDRLLAGGIDQQTAIDLFRAMKGSVSRDDLWKDEAVRRGLKSAVAARVQVVEPPVEEATIRIVFLVGPRGVGKSFTLAKMATGPAARKVSVVSMDVAGAETLRAALGRGSFSGEVGIADAGLNQALALREEGELILVEAQEGGVDPARVSALRELSGVTVEVHLVLSAASPASEMAQWIARCESLSVDRLLFTRLDEAKVFGPLFNAMKESGRPLSYLAMGVRVPEDLEVATPVRIAELLVDREMTIDLTEGLATQESAPGAGSTRVISVTSGKGGVGKTNVVANLAMAFSNLGKRVIVVDADLGLGNLDILFGVVPQFTLEHVLAGQKEITDVLVRGPGNIRILPTSSGAAHLGDLTSEQKVTLLNALDRLEGEADVFLIDTGAGIGSTVLYFNTAAQEILLVVTPEPTSIADAYAMMKVLSKRHGETCFNLVVNMVKNDAEVQEVVRKLSLVAEQFLGVSVNVIGSVPLDDYLRMSVHKQRAVVDLYPNAKSSAQFVQMARKILQKPIRDPVRANTQYVWRRLLSKTGSVV